MAALVPFPPAPIAVEQACDTLLALDQAQQSCLSLLLALTALNQAQQQQQQEQAGPTRGERSVRCPLPQHGREGPSGAAIAASGMAVLRYRAGAGYAAVLRL